MQIPKMKPMFDAICKITTMIVAVKEYLKNELYIFVNTLQLQQYSPLNPCENLRDGGGSCLCYIPTPVTRLIKTIFQ